MVSLGVCCSFLVSVVKVCRVGNCMGLLVMILKLGLCVCYSVDNVVCVDWFICLVWLWFSLVWVSIDCVVSSIDFGDVLVCSCRWVVVIVWWCCLMLVVVMVSCWCVLVIVR